MVLEAIINPEQRLERKPWIVFAIGFLYASVAIIISLGMFRAQASMVVVFLIVFACIHFVYYLVKTEENKDILISNELSLLKEHGKTVAVLLMLFFGVLGAFVAWGVLLPEPVANDLFAIQIQTISGINAASGKPISATFLPFIFFNNIKVLFFCMLFSFIYGAGAIFILIWNASVGGAFIANFIRTKIAYLHPIHSTALGLVRYIPHGFFEMAAYFIGGLAGGIISYAVIKHDFGSHRFFKILFDASDLLLIAIILIVVGAFVEVFVTPMLVSLLSF
jgi:uncharacterized membrane protein SpoIIM required for sporulation